MSDSRDGKEFVGKFYVNGYGNIGLILDCTSNTDERCSWINPSGTVIMNYPVSFERVKESIKNFNEKD